MSMANIRFLPRTGADLFDFMQRSLTDLNLANQWALEQFVQIDGKPLDVFKISKLNDTAYLMITSKIFPSNFDNLVEDNQGIHFNNLIIKEKVVNRDFITNLQTSKDTFKNNYVALCKYCIEEIFNIDISVVEGESYELASHLINKVNMFLKSITTPTDNLELADIWVDDSQQSSNEKLDNVVSDGNKALKEN